MALKERKPTPSEIAETIANNQQPTVEKETINVENKTFENKDSIKFEPKEIEKIQGLQANMNQLIFKMGQLKLSEIKLENTKKSLHTSLDNLEKAEISLAKELNEKYGRGTLDVETGTFTPIK